MPNAFKLLLVFVLSFIVMYLMGGFISLEWDITQWKEESRLGVIFFSTVFTVATIPILFGIEE